MANQPYTRKRFQTDGKPPTYQVEIGIPDASKHAVLYNVVSNSFWALLDWVISIWRFGFGKQKPKDDQRPSGNTRDQNGSFPVVNTPQKHAGKKVKANSRNFSIRLRIGPPSQTQITKDDKPKDDQKPSTTVSDNQAVSRNTRDHNGSSSASNTRQKHGRKKDKADSSNSSTNAKSSRSQTQITRDDKPKDEQKPGTTVSENEICGNDGIDSGKISVGNRTQKHAPKKDKASSSNPSTSAKSSPEDDRQLFDVSRNKITNNKGDRSGNISVGNIQ